MKPGEIVNLKLTVALIWLTIVAGGVYVYVFVPGKTGFFPICPFRALTGFTCPGCGSTRALHHLLHGDVVGAFQLNPFMMVMLPIMLFVLVRHTLAVIGGGHIRMNQLQPKYIWTLFVVVLFFWIFRNTPMYPFVS
ncbi:MAG TPA: DUF2752 domain-containing protein [Pyrinomonadaceae bacterium]|nr:DUF2752 domain-containing protein [Pyrinomonadaceae bacterium]